MQTLHWRAWQGVCSSPCARTLHPPMTNRGASICGSARMAERHKPNPGLKTRLGQGEKGLLFPPPQPFSALKHCGISTLSAPILVAAILNFLLLETRPPWNAFCLQGTENSLFPNTFPARPSRWQNIREFTRNTVRLMQRIKSCGPQGLSLELTYLSPLCSRHEAAL